MKQKSSVRPHLIVGAYCAALIILCLISLIKMENSWFETVGSLIFNVLWALLLAEQAVRVFRMNKDERFRYVKLELIEVIFFVLSLVLLPMSFAGHAAVRWGFLLKMPEVLHHTDDEKSFQFIINLMVGMLIIVFVVPFIQVISVAISAPGETINLLPHAVDLWGLDYVLHDKAFFRSIGTSIFITVVGTILSVTAMTMAAYPLSKKEMPLRRTMLVFFLIVMLFNGGMAPNILLMNSLGLTNTVWALILPSVVMVFHLLLLKGFFEDIPPELEESAKLDGASNYTILFRIIVPVAAPMIATVVFFTAIAFWNNINNSILYITSNQAIYPLPMYIKNFLSTNPVDIANTNPTLLTYWDNVKMGYILCSIVPILLVYPFIFKYIKNGVTMGAVKG